MPSTPPAPWKHSHNANNRKEQASLQEQLAVVANSFDDAHVTPFIDVT